MMPFVFDFAIRDQNFKDIDGSMTFDASGKQTNTRFGAPIAARSPRVMQGR